MFVFFFFFFFHPGPRSQGGAQRAVESSRTAASRPPRLSLNGHMAIAGSKRPTTACTATTACTKRPITTTTLLVRVFEVSYCHITTTLLAAWLRVSEVSRSPMAIAS